MLWVAWSKNSKVEFQRMQVSLHLCPWAIRWSIVNATDLLVCLLLQHQSHNSIVIVGPLYGPFPRQWTDPAGSWHWTSTVNWPNTGMRCAKIEGRLVESSKGSPTRWHLTYAVKQVQDHLPSSPSMTSQQLMNSCHSMQSDKLQHLRGGQEEFAHFFIHCRLWIPSLVCISTCKPCMISLHSA